MPGMPWRENELALLTKLITEEKLTAKQIHAAGYFDGTKEGFPFKRGRNAIQKQMGRSKLADPQRSAEMKDALANRIKGEKLEECIADIRKRYKTTSVETLAAEWNVCGSVIKRLLHQEGLKPLTWAEAINLPGSRMKDPAAIRERANTLTANAFRRRAKLRKTLVAETEAALQENPETKTRVCTGCNNTLLLNERCFSKHVDGERIYFLHLCHPCEGDRAKKDDTQNARVERGEKEFMRAVAEFRRKHPHHEERTCKECDESFPLESTFFQSFKSRANDGTLYSHTCRLCKRTARRARRRLSKMTTVT